ncbi:hypothetical protein ACS0TY_006579 [Phlomoides rotata]
MESLGNYYSQRENNLKVLRVLPTEWDMKVVAKRESKDLSKITTFELFSNLKAFEFDIDRRKDKETPSSKVVALVASTAESSHAVDSESDQDELTLFIKQFRKFVKEGKSDLKKGSSKPTAEGKDSKASKGNNINGFITCVARRIRERIRMSRVLHPSSTKSIRAPRSPSKLSKLVKVHPSSSRDHRRTKISQRTRYQGISGILGMRIK